MNKKKYLTIVDWEKTELNIDPKLGDEELWVCSECGSLDIEEKMWVRVNTGEITDCGDEGLNCYCNNCEEHTYQKTLKQYLLKYD